MKIHNQKLLLAFASLLMVLSYPCLAKDLITGNVTHVIDGDTLDVGKTRIRLWGIDTPERNEQGYEDASAFLQQITLNANLNCLSMYKDKWKRTVASCEVDGQDVGKIMVLSGMARDYKRYSNGFYAKQEALAKKQKIGFWKFWKD